MFGTRPWPVYQGNWKTRVYVYKLKYMCKIFVNYSQTKWIQEKWQDLTRWGNRKTGKQDWQQVSTMLHRKNRWWQVDTIIRNTGNKGNELESRVFRVKMNQVRKTMPKKNLDSGWDIDCTSKKSEKPAKWWENTNRELTQKAEVDQHLIVQSKIRQSKSKGERIISMSISFLYVCRSELGK